MTTDRKDPAAVDRLRCALGPPLALAAIATLFVAGVFAVGDAVLTGAPTPESPGFVDSLLASRAVLAATRLAIIAAAAYIVASAAALVVRRQWLIRVGPVEASAWVSDLEAENAVLRDALDRAERKVGYLKEELAAAENVVDSTLGNIGQRWERK